MDTNDDLEEGEIEELTDDDKTLSELIGLSNNIQTTKRIPNFLEKPHNESFNSWRKKEKKLVQQKRADLNKHSTSSTRQKNGNSKPIKDATYEMDDYQLLLARHQLIQQQLDKVNAEKVSKKKVRTKKIKSAKNKKVKIDGHKPKSRVDQYKVEPESDITSGKQGAIGPELENDVELLALRKALLAQTSMKKEDVKQIGSHSKEKLTVSNVKTAKDASVNPISTAVEILPGNVRETFSNPMTQARLHDSKVGSSGPVTVDDNKKKEQLQLYLEPKVEVIDILSDSSDETNLSNSRIVTPQISSSLQNVQVVSSSMLNTLQTSSSSEVSSSLGNVKCALSQNQRLTKSQRKRLNKKIRKPAREIVTRSKAATSSQSNDLNQSTSNLDDWIYDLRQTTKKRRRAGRRSKYLALRAQQRKELEILQQQQEEVDNYSSVPMDIDDESGAYSNGIAPLPLIETNEYIPPPPPSDGFQPAPDQASLSMTSSNVAWMPGYVESLGEENASVSFKPTDKPQLIKSPRLQQKADTEAGIANKIKEKTENDENEVWALRAQALKSLACKRAAKVKQMNKEKNIVLSSEVKAPIVPTAKKLIPGLESPVSPASPVSSALTSSKNTYNKVQTRPLNSYAPPPVHAPVIIRLTKEDFILDDSWKSKPNRILSKINTELRRKRSSIEGHRRKVQLNIANTNPKNSVQPSKSAVVKMNGQLKKSQTVNIVSNKSSTNSSTSSPIIHSTSGDTESDVAVLDSSSSSLTKKLNADAILKKVNARLNRKQAIEDDSLLKNLLLIADSTSHKMKIYSSSIVKDQLSYRKLQADINEHRDLFDKQANEVRQLQEQLQKAMKEKTATKKAHNKLHSQIKQVKERLKEKINLRKSTDEEVLRARSLVSVNRLKLNAQGTILPKMKDHMVTLHKTLENSRKKLTLNEKLDDSSSQDETDVSLGKNCPSAVIKSSQHQALMKTAADVQTMSKQDLAKLELELREKLKKFRSAQTGQSSDQSKSAQSNDEGKRISLDILPLVTSLKGLKSLQKRLSDSFFATPLPINTKLMKYSQVLSNRVHSKCLQIINEQSDQISSHEADAVFNTYLSGNTYTKYKTSLTRFRSYRLSPYYRTQSKFAIQSNTFTHHIDAKKIMCKYDLFGTCNDKSCSYWHYNSRCNLSVEETVKDLVSYDLRTFNATPEMNKDTKIKLLSLFTKQFFEQYEGKMSSDEKLLLLWNQLKESRRSRKETTYECISFHKRDWFLANPVGINDQSFTVELYNKTTNPVYFVKKKKKNHAAYDGEKDESQEVRYFSETYNSIEVLKAALAENPSDVKLWLALANRYLKTERTDETSTGEPSNAENALAILSQGLEENRDSEQLWIRYLKLFSVSSSSDELRELCYQAVMYAATYTVWWTCLNLESLYLGKQEICTEMIKFVFESIENKATKSHYLLETVLYVTRLLTCREKIATAISYISAALGLDDINNEKEKLQLGNITHHVTIEDRSLLWLCLICLQVFHSLPNCLFKVEETTPGRIIRKNKFILNWDKRPKNLSDAKILQLFQDSVELGSIKRSRSTMKAMVVLHENFVAFEVSSGNIQSAVNYMQSLVTAEPSFVEGWVLLLSLYVDHSPMDAVVTVAEDAIHRCEHDVEVVYFYTRWLLKQGMPNLALEKLTKCIHVYFQFDGTEEEIPDVLYLYRKVLGLPVPYTTTLTTYLPGLKSSQHLMLYYWLCYCLLLKIKVTPPSTLNHDSAIDEAFESAVHQYTSRENTEKLWLLYLGYRIDCLIRQQHCSLKHYQAFEDLLFRALSANNASVVLPYSKLYNWKDYSFHNKVLEICLQAISVERHSQVYQKAIRLMPENVELALRICQHEYHLENYEQARIICASLVADYPNCLDLWRMAIKVELKCNCIKEVRWLYEEGTKSLPFCSNLWKDNVSFEIVHSTGSEKLHETLESIILRASKNGVELREYVANLSPK